jgi:PAS domain-containing protein
MKRVCAWCGKSLGTAFSDVHSDALITHGICDECAFHLRAQVGMPLRDFLDGLGVPVLLLDSDGNVKTANKTVRQFLKKDLTQIEGNKGGDVFECRHATLPGGCGKTVHCSGCTIRRTVMDTFSSGKSQEKLRAYLNRETPDGSQPLRLLISTEKVHDVVLLRIDEITVDEEAQPAKKSAAIPAQAGDYDGFDHNEAS